MTQPPEYKVNQKVLIVRDNSGWYHGACKVGEVTIKEITPLPEIETYEYTVMDKGGDFWHIPQSDLKAHP